MVKRIRELFRNGDTIRKQWCAFCSTHGGAFDPDLHEEAWLATFFDALELDEIGEFRGTLPPDIILMGRASLEVPVQGTPVIGKDVTGPAGVLSEKGGGAVSPGKIYVGGLPRTATEQAIRQYFSAYGYITGIHMKYTEDGSSRNFCFVQFQDTVSAQRAMADGKAGKLVLDGRWLDVRDPTPKGSGKGVSCGGKGAPGDGAWGGGPTPAWGDGWGAAAAAGPGPGPGPGPGSGAADAGPGQAGVPPHWLAVR